MMIQERLVNLFYLLLRDHLTVGAVNELLGICIGTAEKPVYSGSGKLLSSRDSFSDSLLEVKARSLADQLIDGEYRVREEEVRELEPC
jgi:hypothetical protein